MECRPRAVDRKQSEYFRYLRGREWQKVAASNKSIQRKSEF